MSTQTLPLGQLRDALAGLGLLEVQELKGPDHAEVSVLAEPLPHPRLQEVRLTLVLAKPHAGRRPVTCPSCYRKVAACECGRP